MKDDDIKFKKINEMTMILYGCERGAAASTSSVHEGREQ